MVRANARALPMVIRALVEYIRQEETGNNENRLFRELFSPWPSHPHPLGGLLHMFGDSAALFGIFEVAKVCFSVLAIT